MSTFRRPAAVTALICVLSLVRATAAPPHFVTIDHQGATSTSAFGINDNGDIVGAFVDGSGEHGFVLSRGTFIQLDWPGATWTEAWGINPQGDVVGQYGWLAAGVNTVHGFLFKDGVMSSIDVPNQPNTMPVKISPDGTIVGCYHVGTASGAVILPTMYGFVRNGDVITPQSSARTMDNGVNPRGDVVGLYFSPTTNRVEQSYLISDGEVTWYQADGAVSTQAWDIAPNGTIVGFVRSSLSGPNQFHGLVIERGDLSTFDVPGSTATRAYGINASGDVVGSYVNASGTHGYLWTKKDTNGDRP